VLSITYKPTAFRQTKSSELPCSRSSYNNPRAVRIAFWRCNAACELSSPTPFTRAHRLKPTGDRPLPGAARYLFIARLFFGSGCPGGRRNPLCQLGVTKYRCAGGVSRLRSVGKTARRGVDDVDSTENWQGVTHAVTRPRLSVPSALSVLSRRFVLTPFLLARIRPQRSPPDRRNVVPGCSGSP
jgi:hypothetical protein